MKTDTIHLTDMVRKLKHDIAGTYRRQLLDTLVHYQQQFKRLMIPDHAKKTYLHVCQAFECAQTILTKEE